MKYLLNTALLALLISACSSPQTTTEPAMVEEGFITCEGPRAEICTREYKPVCGHIENGTRCVRSPCDSIDHRTYGNACSACADSDVIGYEKGSCASYGKGAGLEGKDGS